MDPDAAASLCPVCGGRDVTSFATFPEIPIACNILWGDREAARSVPKGNIELTFCHRCGHVYNAVYDPSLSSYSPDYDNSLHYSPRFQAYAEELAAQLIDRYDLRGKQIVEIGCGKAEFLGALCALGDNRGIGFDPSYVPGRTAPEVDERITIVRDFYSERYVNHAADLICCRHVLEHIAQPRAFLQTIRGAIGEQGTPVYFEVPNFLVTLQDGAIWDIIYDHCSYFSPSSLRAVFLAAGFEVTALRQVFGRQFLAIEARPTGADLAAAREGPEDMEHDITTFASTVRREVKRWRRELEGVASSGKRVVAWGAGSKGVMFLNALGDAGNVRHIVDLNPHKQGKYVAGSGQEIVAPEALRAICPDVVIVMNPIYTDEIRAMLAGLGVEAQLLSS